MRALVIGASGGIGAAMTTALRERGADVTALSRSADGLDITSESSVAQHLGRLSGPFHRILIVTGGLEIEGNGPEKSLRHITPDPMIAQYRLNALGPALVIKHAVDLLPRDEPAVLAVLSARVGSIGDNRAGGWYGYRAAKAALNQILRSAAIELGRTRKQLVCVALHPGTVQTDLTRNHLGSHPAVQPADAAENLLRVIDGLTPADTGQFFDWAGKPVPW